MRKKASIAARKNVPQNSSTSQPPRGEIPQALAEAEHEQEEPVSKEITLEDLHASREFKAITEFLGSGGADGITDEQVWPILSQKVRACFIFVSCSLANKTHSILTSHRKSGFRIGRRMDRKLTKS